MKLKYLLLIICIFGNSVLNAQNSFQKLFDKYENEDDVTIVSISKAMINMIPGTNITGKFNIGNIIQKMESLLIISSSDENIKKKMNVDFKALIDKDKDYEELIKVREGKSSITINTKKKGNTIKELIMLVNEEEDFVAIQILGNFTVEDIQNLAIKIK